MLSILFRRHGLDVRWPWNKSNPCILLLVAGIALSSLAVIPSWPTPFKARSSFQVCTVVVSKTPKRSYTRKTAFETERLCASKDENSNPQKERVQFGAKKRTFFRFLRARKKNLNIIWGWGESLIIIHPALNLFLLPPNMFS